MARTNAETRYQALKENLLTVGYIRPGSLVRRFMPCGKKGCRCQGDPPILHGPYYQWTRKVRGKTVTIRLSQAQAQQCDDWLRNHRRFKKIVRQMETLSLKETDRILRMISMG